MATSFLEALDDCNMVSQVRMVVKHIPDGKAKAPALKPGLA
jgi:hypothetical protein